MQNSSNPQRAKAHLSSKWREIGLFLLLWAILFSLTYISKTGFLEAERDLYPRWVGARAMLEGENPYSQAVTERVQLGRFGRLLEADEDQQRFAYPATITWLLLPLWLLSYPLAASIWASLSLSILIYAPRFYPDWRPSALTHVIVALLTVIFYRYSIMVYLIEQFTAVMLGTVFLGVYGLIKRQAHWTIIALLLLTIRPEMVLLGLFLTWELWRGRYYRALALGALALVILYLLSHAMIGFWLDDFIGGLSAYTDYSFPVWPPATLGLGVLAYPIAGLIVLWAGWLLWETRRLALEERLYWQVAVLILFSLLILTQTGVWIMTLALWPLWLVLWAFRGRWWIWGLVLLVVPLSWMTAFVGYFPPPRHDQFIIPVYIAFWLTLAWRFRKSSRPLRYN